MKISFFILAFLVLSHVSTQAVQTDKKDSKKSDSKPSDKDASSHKKLEGSCPGASSFKFLKVLDEPIEYNKDNKVALCPKLQSGCCSVKSLNDYLTEYKNEMRQKAAFFWTLTKWPNAITTMLKWQKKGIKCGLKTDKKDSKKDSKKEDSKKEDSKKEDAKEKSAEKAKRILQSTTKKNAKVVKCDDGTTKPAKIKIHIKKSAKKETKKSDDSDKSDEKKEKPSKKSDEKKDDSKKSEAKKDKKPDEKKDESSEKHSKKSSHKVKVHVHGKSHHKSKKSHKKVKITIHQHRDSGKEAKDATKKAGSAIKVAVKKTGDAVKKGVKATGDAVKKGVKATGDFFKKTFNKVKNGISKGWHNMKWKIRFWRKGSIKTFLKGTECHPKFTSAWHAVMQYMSMRNAAYDQALGCFKAITHAKASTICSVCDNNQASSYKEHLWVAGLRNMDVFGYCSNFLTWINSSFDVQAKVADYVASVSNKKLNIAKYFKKQHNTWTGEISKCFAHGKPAHKKESKKSDKKDDAKKSEKKDDSKKEKDDSKKEDKKEDSKESDKKDDSKKTEKKHKVPIRVPKDMVKKIQKQIAAKKEKDDSNKERLLQAKKPTKKHVKIRVRVHKKHPKHKIRVRIHKKHPKSKIRIRVHKKHPKSKIRIRVHKPHAKKHIKIGVKKPAYSINISGSGWSLNKPFNNFLVTDSTWTGYFRMPMAELKHKTEPTTVCYQSPLMQRFIERAVFGTEADHAAFLKWYFSGMIKMNSYIGGKDSRFMAFLGHELMHLKKPKKTKVKVHVKAKKAPAKPAHGKVKIHIKKHAAKKTTHAHKKIRIGIHSKPPVKVHQKIRIHVRHHAAKKPAHHKVKVVHHHHAAKKSAHHHVKIVHHHHASKKTAHKKKKVVKKAAKKTAHKKHKVGIRVPKSMAKKIKKQLAAQKKAKKAKGKKRRVMKTIKRKLVKIKVLPNGKRIRVVKIVKAPRRLQAKETQHGVFKGDSEPMAAAHAKLKFNINPKGVNLSAKKFEAQIPEPETLAGLKDQVNPSKSWMTVLSGLTILVSCLLF